MKALGSPEGRALVERLARAATLVGLDFDGTLAPIVDDPEDAVLSPATRALLHRVALLYPTVVISGRGRADLGARLAGLPLAALFGNHGFEAPDLDEAGRRAELRVRQWTAQLRVQLAGAPIQIEDKRLSLTLHYRGAAAPAAAEALIEGAIATLSEHRLVRGKLSVSLLPPGATHKGDALLAERARHGSELVLFVGDDVTDEDAFAAEGVLGVRVGFSAGSRAAWFLERREEVDGLLEELARRRGDAVATRRGP